MREDPWTILLHTVVPLCNTAGQEPLRQWSKKSVSASTQCLHACQLSTIVSEHGSGMWPLAHAFHVPRPRGSSRPAFPGALGTRASFPWLPWLPGGYLEIYIVGSCPFSFVALLFHIALSDLPQTLPRSRVIHRVCTLYTLRSPHFNKCASWGGVEFSELT
jgi:hypothetical protein